MRPVAVATRVPLFSSVDAREPGARVHVVLHDDDIRLKVKYSTDQSYFQFDDRIESPCRYLA